MFWYPIYLLLSAIAFWEFIWFNEKLCRSGFIVMVRRSFHFFSSLTHSRNLSDYIYAVMLWQSGTSWANIIDNYLQCCDQSERDMVETRGHIIKEWSGGHFISTPHLRTVEICQTTFYAWCFKKAGHPERTLLTTISTAVTNQNATWWKHVAI